MPPALIVAGIGAAGAIGGAVMGAKSQKSAAKSAANAQTQASQQQLQLGRETNALNREIYDKNAALLNPFVQRGNVAGDQINAMLGLGSQPMAAQPQMGQGQAPVGQQGDQMTEEWANGALNAMGLGSRGNSPATLQAHLRGELEGQLPANLRQAYESYIQNNPQQVAQPAAQPVAAQPVAQSAQPVSAAQPSQVAQSNPMETFANSAGMQFQLKQGVNALEHSAAARGMLQSGATLKGIQNYGQQTALNNYFMPYMGLLGGQQSTGAQSASAVAGVGSNFVNTAAGIAANQGNAIQSGANALSNGAIARGVAGANMWSGIGSALGTAASSFAPQTSTYQFPSVSGSSNINLQPRF